MTDIVDRLRGYVSESWGSALRDTREAADEIERLRAELAALRASSASVQADQRAENERLRAERDALRAALVECEHQTHSLRVWAGSSWSYHPPQAGRIAKVARAALESALAAECRPYDELSAALGCDPTDSHDGRLYRAKVLAHLYAVEKRRAGIGLSAREQDAEPVAWLCELMQEDDTIRKMVVLQDPAGLRFNDIGEPSPFRVTPLYASPPKREPLTDGDIARCMTMVSDPLLWGRMGENCGVLAAEFARAVERAHGVSDE